MLGIDDTSIRASGSPVLRVVRPVRRLVRKLSTDVIAASDEVHTSLAPRRIRTWSGLLGAATALVAWAGSPAIFAPVTASFPPTVALVCGRASSTDGLSALTRLK